MAAHGTFGTTNGLPQNMWQLVKVFKLIFCKCIRSRSWYALLHVEQGAHPDEVRQAFKRLALKTHPDTGGNAAAFQAVMAAFEILGDSEKRAHYDQDLLATSQVRSRCVDLVIKPRSIIVLLFTSVVWFSAMVKMILMVSREI